jgi:hypothetical protein
LVTSTETYIIVSITTFSFLLGFEKNGLLSFHGHSRLKHLRDLEGTTKDYEN